LNILIAHNFYKQRGGEDVIFESESKLLEDHGHNIYRYAISNKDINGTFKSLAAGVSAVYNSASARRIKEVIADFNPDVIHVHNFWPMISPAIFYEAKKANVPIVHSIHNFRLLCPSAYLYFDHAIYEKSINKVFPFDAIRKGVYRNSKIQTAVLAFMTAYHNKMGTWKNKIDQFIINTEFAKKKFLASSLELTDSQFYVKPNFVPDYQQDSHQRQRLDQYLFVGRLSEEKGLEVLVETFKRLKLPITIVGDGPLKNLVEQAANECPTIHYVGFKNKQEVIEYLKTTRAMILPSLWYEGLPMTLMEAFCMGAPVIASNLGAMAETIVHGENGLLFETGSSVALEKQLNQLEQNENLRQKLASGARNAYLSRYTPEINYKMLVEVYQKAMEIIGISEGPTTALPS